MIRTSTCFLALYLALAPAAWSADVDLADKPLASGTSGEVKPNVMLVVDDSGSMSFTYMPDNAVTFHGKYGYASSQCNSVYYDPAVTYRPPVKADGSDYPNADFTSARDDGFNNSSATSNLNTGFYANRFSPESANNSYNSGTYKSYKYSALGPGSAYYYVYNGTVTKKDYLDTDSTFYEECNSSLNDGPDQSVFSKRRLATTMTTTIVVSAPSRNARSTVVSSIEVNNVNIMSGDSVGSTSSSTVARNIAQKIGGNGYTATSNGSTVIITGPAAAANQTPVITRKSGNLTFETDVFPETDPAKLTNFANWYSYYRARILAAKSAVGQALNTLSEPGNYRIGYRVLNATGANASHAIDDFCDAGTSCSQRTSVYSKLYAASPNGGTPLQKVLAEVGRMYAGKTGTDPVQYSCQQNFTILTTDGFWNGSDKGKKIDGSSNIGNEDGSAARPMLDALGATGALADIAMYYYETDLRTAALNNCTGSAVDGTSFDVCENNVPGSGSDKATHQHMTTFTLGLGVSGELEYCENYDSGACADFEAIRQGTKNWPKPAADKLTTVDDLWHAAVNGRGKYFSAQSPESMSKGVQKALAGVSARTASAAAAATSTLEPVTGDNQAYVAMYTTVDWDGDIISRDIDLGDGAVSDDANWSAQARLDLKVGTASDTRQIYFNKDGALSDFTAGNLAAQVTAKYFEPGPDNPNGPLSHYVDLNSNEQAQATQDSVIGFLRGQTQHEDQDGNDFKLYRDRKHALGDIVNGAPVYVRQPPFAYSDDNYAQFAEQNADRRPVVYAGANDGMLHAFDGDTGDELWAWVPTAVIPHLYKLADRSYDTNHRFYVDGPIVIGDFCPTSSCTAAQWKTILVGGLGKGGRAYYALDVTNPTSPQLLWEFTDNNLGQTFGNPVITKVNNQWVVIVASGYNNNMPNDSGANGDGKGRLFVLKAADGSKLAEIKTDDTADPSRSGVAKINNWVDDTLLDNSTAHVYAGDLDGNVWRFDVTTQSVTKITTIGKSGIGTQPITTKPELAEVKIDGVATRIILIGAGKYLGTSDVGSSDRMSLYAIRDDLVSPPYGTFRSSSKVVVQDLTATGGRQVSYTGMEPDSIGWYMDYDVKNGERVNVDPKYQLGWWVVPTNIPDPNVCNIGGTSWLYFMDPWPKRDRTSEVIWAVNVGNALIVGINIVKLPNGKIVTIATTSDAKYPVFGNPPSLTSAGMRRISWRELTR